MSRPLIRALGLGVFLPCMALAMAGEPGMALLPVPVALLPVAQTGPGPIRHVSGGSSDAATEDAIDPPAAVLAVGPKTLTVSPGTTTIVEVAIDHLNRIVTPFGAPQVRTVSTATTQVDGNVVYVATSSEEPVGLFITEAGDTANALSLTLAPRHIPPREVRLVLAGGALLPGVASARPPAAPTGESDQPYVEQLVAAFRALAQDRLPTGYGPGVAARGERIDCRLPGVALSTTRVLDGGRLRLLTARAENRGQTAVELAEHRCTVGRGTVTAAVAFWPRRQLAPGEETQVYVAVRPAGERREGRTGRAPAGPGR